MTTPAGRPRPDNLRGALWMLGSALGFTAIWDDSPAAFTEVLRVQEPIWRDLVEGSGAKLD